MKVKLLRVVAISMSMLFATTAIAEIKVGFIGSLSSDTGLSTLRGAEIAIDELNAKGGVLGQQIKLVTADTRQDVTEGVGTIFIPLNNDHRRCTIIKRLSYIKP